jgi:RNA polymerase sigma-70 factor (ECF subfamily)
MDSPSPSDRDGVERLRAGDRQALAGLFSRHHDRLWRMVSFRLDPRLRGRVDPEDVLQEAYLAAEQRLEHCRGETTEAQFIWLRLIVLQTMVDVYRRHVDAQMRDAGREVAIGGGGGSQTTATSMTLQLAGSLTSPSQAAVRAETYRILEQAIDGMDPIDREVLALRHFEELSNAEVAEALGIQVKAASIRYVRAVRRLKEILTQVSGLSDEASHA